MNAETAHKIAAAAFGLATIFPPFAVGLPRGDETGGCGFGFVFLEQQSARFDLPCRVDIPLLLVEWAFIAICLLVLHRKWIAEMLTQAMNSGKQNREVQVMLANKQADLQCEVARIIANAIVQRAEEQRKQ